MGKPNAAPSERAVLSSSGTGKAAMMVSRFGFDKLKIRFEHIEIGGANRKSDGGGLIVRGGAEVILGSGTRVSNNRAINAAGVMVMNSSVLTLDGGEVRGNTALNWGGGVLVSETGVFIMTGGVIRDNVTAGTGGGRGSVCPRYIQLAERRD
jgi:hypothetical protein